MAKEIDRILQIKEQIEKAKSQSSKIDGQLSEIESQMEKKFKVKNKKDADKMLEGLDGTIKEKEEKYQTGLEELESAYEWAN